MLVPEKVLRSIKYHMVGIEPYLISVLKNHGRGLVLDLGIGLGFWGYIMKSYVAMGSASKPVIVGVDMDKSVLSVLRGMNIYSELVCADIRRLPFKAESFDTVMSIESAFACGSQDILRAIERLAKSGGLVVLSGHLEKERARELLNQGYDLYNLYLWGIMLKRVRDGKSTYIDDGLRRFSPLIRLLRAFLHPGQVDYVIALYAPKSEQGS